MRTILATTIVLALTSGAAHAQERAGDAALGALSGALVFGPVGLVAGAVVGFTAGPAISRSWSANRNHPRPQARAAKRPTHVAARARPAVAPAAGEVTPARPAPGAGGPPAQGLE